MSGIFCFVPLRECADGSASEEEGAALEPAYVDGIAVHPVCLGPPGGDWIVAECTWNDADTELPASYQPVPERLQRALTSGKRFPPAIALANETMVAAGFSPTMAREELAAAYASEIEARLQDTTRFLMVRATTECPIGYRFANEYVWIVGHCRRCGRVSWVTDDYQVYQERSEAFDLGARCLETELPELGSPEPQSSEAEASEVESPESQSRESGAPESGAPESGAPKSLRRRCVCASSSESSVADTRSRQQTERRDGAKRAEREG